jgi:hypothetical protein
MLVYNAIRTWASAIKGELAGWPFLFSAVEGWNVGGWKDPPRMRIMNKRTALSDPKGFGNL